LQEIACALEMFLLTELLKSALLDVEMSTLLRMLKVNAFARITSLKITRANVSFFSVRIPMLSPTLMVDALVFLVTLKTPLPKFARKLLAMTHMLRDLSVHAKPDISCSQDHLCVLH
jgi:hypothetical protein